MMSISRGHMHVIRGNLTGASRHSKTRSNYDYEQANTCDNHHNNPFYNLHQYGYKKQNRGNKSQCC